MAGVIRVYMIARIELRTWTTRMIRVAWHGVEIDERIKCVASANPLIDSLPRPIVVGPERLKQQARRHYNL
jgi:hypothetical protein